MGPDVHYEATGKHWFPAIYINGFQGGSLQLFLQETSNNCVKMVKPFITNSSQMPKLLSLMYNMNE